MRLDQRDGGILCTGVEDELAHGQHRRRAVDRSLLLDERDRADDGAPELVAARPLVVLREHLRDVPAGAAPLADANAQDMRIGKQALDVGLACLRGVGEGAVEWSRGRVRESELCSGREIREVDQEIRSLRGRQHESLARNRDGHLE